MRVSGARCTAVGPWGDLGPWGLLGVRRVAGDPGVLGASVDRWGAWVSDALRRGPGWVLGVPGVLGVVWGSLGGAGGCGVSMRVLGELGVLECVGWWI